MKEKRERQKYRGWLMWGRVRVWGEKKYDKVRVRESSREGESENWEGVGWGFVWVKVRERQLENVRDDKWG